MKTKSFSSFLSIFFFLCLTNTVFSKDLFWVNGEGDWNDGTHWSYKSGGNADNIVPNEKDNVFFDENSFLTAGSITIVGNAFCTDFYFGSITQKVTIKGSTNSNLNIYGSLVFSGIVDNHFFGSLNFLSEKKGNIINTSNTGIAGDLVFNGKGDWILKNSIYSNEKENTITLIKGELNTNSHNIIFPSFVSDGAEKRKLVLGASVFYIKKSWQILSSENFDFEAGTSSVLIERAVSQSNIEKGEIVYHHFKHGKAKDPITCTAVVSTDYNGEDISCNGFSDAEICVNVTGGTGRFNYSWSGGTSMPPVAACWTNVGVGNYTIIVTDSADAAACGATVEVSEPSPISPFNFNTITPTCNTFCDGGASLITLGGTPNYNYLWSSGETTQTASALCVGNNTLTITDANGCTFDTTVSITLPLVIAPNVTTQDPTCFGLCNGRGFSNPSGGNGAPYTVIWREAGSGALVTDTDSLCGPSSVGTYNVRVVDGLNCSSDTTVTINEPAEITINFPTITNALCNGSCDGSITAVASNGSPPYFYDWYDCNTNALVGSGATINTLCAGDYYVIVTDDNTCTSSSASACITITEPQPLIITLDATTDATCGPVCDGSGAVTTGGGTPGYLVNWYHTLTGIDQGTTGLTNATLCADTYYAEVTDNNGCTAQTADFVINENVLITVTPTVTDAACFGFCDGQASAVGAGGAAPYTYEWIDITGPTVIGTSNTIAGLCSGDYTVQATDDNGCSSAPVLLNVTESPELFANGAKVDAFCNGDCDGEASVTPTGGTGIYSYNWPAIGITDSSRTGLCAGTWNVIVTDDLGCVVDTNILVDEPPPFDLTISTTNILCNGVCNGQAIITDNNGGAGNTYDWTPDPPGGDGNPIASGLCAGNYTVLITSPTGCDTLVPVTISQPSLLSVTTSVIANNTCFGDCNGVALATIGGGAGGNIITWDDPANQSTSVATGLCAGTYNVTVQDANGCVGTESVTITEPTEYDITVATNNLSCNGACDGDATVTVNSGGTPNYSYSWNDPLNQSTPNAVGLCAGTYQVTISDMNGCDSIMDIAITEPDVLAAGISGTNLTCFGICDGEGSLTITGGTPNYNTTWFNTVTSNPIGQTTPIASALCSGTYHATVVDDNGCSVTSASIVLTEPSQITLTNTTTTTSTCNVCTGTASVTATGGTGVFVDFNWTPNPGGGQGTNFTTGLCGGAYQVTVMDNNGCSEPFIVPITDANAEIVTASSTNATCFGDTDGTATATFICSDPPCNILWFDASTNLSIGQTTAIATNLGAGDYYVRVRNSSNCTTIENISITEPAPLIANGIAADPTCNGLCDGIITVAPTGGTGAGTYTYNWVPIPAAGQGTATASGLCSGAWDVTITDANLCNITPQYTITDQPLLDVSNTTSTAITCNGYADGTASVFPTGGLGIYTYEWFECITDNPIGQTTQQATNLPPGDYYVTVTDNGICPLSTVCISITEPDVISGVITTTGSCFGVCEGAVNVVAAGGNANYNYQWLDGTGTPVVGGIASNMISLCADDYSVQITDLLGCNQTIGPETVVGYPEFNVGVSSTDVTCFGDCDGSASVTVNAGGVAPYNYQWDDPANQTTSAATGLCPGIYNVTITGINGCDTIISVTINEPPTLYANLNYTDASCNGLCDGMINSNPIGGTGIYTYTWSPGGAASKTISSLCARAYTLRVQDSNGCQKDTSYTITEPSAIVGNVATNGAQCNVCNGSASASPAGGSGGPFNLVWNPAPGGGQGTQNVTGLCAGIYTVDITDNSGCTTSFPANITNIGGEVYSTTLTPDTVCYSDCNAQAAIEPFVCSDPPCTVEWFDVATNTSLSTATSVNNLCADDYYVEVINNAGCIVPEVFTIVERDSIIPNEIITQVTCSGSADGAILVTPTGGSGNYTYVWAPAPPIGAGTNNASGLSPGVWGLTISDDAGCQNIFSFTITELNPLFAPTSSTNTSCNGVCDGTMAVSASGGSGTYTYQWLNSVGLPIIGETSATISGLCASDYSVQVTDAMAGFCNITSNVVTIMEPNVLIINSITRTNPLCNGDCTGQLVVDVAGGTLPYTVNWYDAGTNTFIGQTGLTATNLCAGDYYVVISDDNGCTITSATETLSDPLLLQANPTFTPPTCFGDCDGSALANTSGGTGGYTYQWLDGSGSAVPGGAIVSNLCSDNYTLEVTDGNSCSTGVINVAVTQPSQITANVFSNSSNCNVADGSATVFPSGGTPNYIYQWFDQGMNSLGVKTQTISNIAAGTYFVQVDDSRGCNNTFSVNVSNFNAPVITFDNISNASCFGVCDGTIDVTVSGVNSPFILSWAPGGQTTDDLTGLCAGRYTLRAEDAVGCITFNDTTIVEPNEIIIDTTITDASCNACDGAVVISVMGGSGNYNYSWNNGNSASTAANLCVGAYTVDISDDVGCTAPTLAFAISELGSEVISVTVTNDSLCYNTCNAQVTIEPFICSDPPCLVEWFETSTGTSLGTATSVANLCGGSYHVDVTNNSNCTVSEAFTIVSLDSIIPNEVITQVTCTGSANGEIQVTPTGGNGTYSYSWTPAPPSGAGTNHISNLTPGNWGLTITDGLGCQNSFSYTITELTPINVSVTPTNVDCNGACNGSISTTVTGGSGSFTYQWLDFTSSPIAGETSATINNLCPRDYAIRVRDITAAICFTTTNPTTITEPTLITVNSITVTDPLCNSDCNGELTIDVAGGTGSLTVDWFDANTNTLIGQTGLTASNLCSGDYYAIITDGSGCTLTSGTSTLSNPIVLQANPIITDATCSGDCDGTGIANASGGTGAYSYEWLDASGSAISGGTLDNVSNLCSGNYTLEVTDMNNCSTGVLPIVVVEPTLVSGTIITSSANCSIADGSATVNAGGGTPGYTYQWFDQVMTNLGVTTPTIPSLSSGTYFVRVEDTRGCFNTFTANISNINAPTITVDNVTDVSCFSLCDGSIDVTVSGGNAPYIYSWNPDGDVSEDISNLCAGTYTLRVEDAASCISFVDTIIQEPTQLVVNQAVTEPACGLCDGDIALSVSGGSGSYNYLWSNGNNTSTANNLCAGSYTIVVTDNGTGCQETVIVSLSNSSGPDNETIALTSPSCSGLCDGSVTVTPSGGTLPYTYLWPHDGSTTNNLAAVCAGTYSLEVSDSNSCIRIIPVIVTEPDGMIDNEIIAPATCGICDGTITPQISGGTPNYTYSWSNGSNANVALAVCEGIYTLDVTDANGCQETFLYTVNGDNAPSVSLTANDESCNGSCDGDITSVTSGGTPAYIYSWLDDQSTPLGISTSDINGLCNGTYILQVDDAGGCSGFETIDINSPTILNFSTASVTDVLCQSDCNGTITAIPNGGTLPYTYLWDDPSAQATSTATNLCPNTFQVTVTDANGCTNNQSSTINSPSAITISIDAITQSQCVNTTDGAVSITAGGGSPGYTYRWTSIPAGYVSTNEDLSSLLPMNYVIEVTDTNGCTFSDTAAIDTAIVVLADAGINQTLCFGDSATLSGSIIGAGITSQWQDQVGTVLANDTVLFNLSPLLPSVATYYLSVTDGTCSHTDSVYITTNALPAIDAGQNQQLIEGVVISIGGNPTAPPNSTYLWTPDTYLSDPTVANPTLEPDSTTTYHLLVTDINGCQALDSIEVIVFPDIVFPNGISPNGDGVNDDWVIDLMHEFPENVIEIYSRWGEMVFRNVGYTKKWDGNFNGKPLPVGTYYYVINLNHPLFPDAFTGPITIMR